MYHCRLHIYLTGHQPALWETVKSIPPLDKFTHTFFVSAAPDGELAAGADVILADLRGVPEDAVSLLCQSKKQDAELILLA